MNESRVRPWKAATILVGVGLAVAGAVVACGSDDGGTVDAGTGGSDGAISIDGTTGLDDGGGVPGEGGTGIGKCAGSGASCTVATDCCTLSCVGGACSATQCTSDHKACTSGAECCSGTCGSDGTCTPLNTTCSTAGNTCASNSDCCSTLCSGGTCQLAASYCIQAGDLCAKATDCCTGTCSIATGATVGTCSALPNLGRNNCSGGVDGTVCSGSADGGTGCLDCCSRLCAPYAPTGVSICQPANGCHVEGDLCRKDADCCGGEDLLPDGGEPLPGAKRVQCLKASGADTGYCASPTSGGPGLNSCNPEGNVCHYKGSDYACGNSSEENNCCEHLGAATDCELDALGVPRCHVVGGDAGVLPCIPTDGECAFDGDCCGGKCLPNSSGLLVCNPVKCSPSAGTCTTTADCCNGLNCNVPPGSTTGTCGGSTSGSPDGGPGSCSAYGQSCTTASDCCNNVPCTSGTCLYPPR